MTFIYLIQTEKNTHRWEKFNTSNRKIILGVWKDTVLDSQINLHDTTCASGRNKMFQYINDSNLISDYDYVTFCDDDIDFSIGAFDDYEATVEKFNKPLYHATFEDHSDARGWKWHTTQSEQSRLKGNDIWFTDRIDTCFFGVRKDVLGKIMPFVTMFDKINWWTSVEIFCTVVKNLDMLWAITANFTVKNTQSRDYPRQVPTDILPNGKKFINFCKDYIRENYIPYENLVLETNKEHEHN
jgi:hypothetical protein